MFYCVRLLVLVLAHGLLLSVSGVMAHGGGLDAQGGHTDRSTGQYHCHRAPCSLDDEDTASPITEGNYDRDNWSHWLDEDGDCLNTRHEVLLAQSIGTVVYSSNGCRRCRGSAWLSEHPGPSAAITLARPVFLVSRPNHSSTIQSVILLHR